MRVKSRTHKFYVSRRGESQLGFSAIEVTMVATVIAILALIALPVYIKRLEDARVKSTFDEMDQIGKALMLAKADSSEYPRLNDLDNTERFVDGDNNGVPDTNVGNAQHAQEYVPSAYWNKLFLPGGPERAILAPRWKGGYIVYQNNRSISLWDIDQDPNLQNMLSTNGGPVPYQSILPADQLDQYPVDAWGTPYLFFGTGTPIQGAPTETNFLTARIYSLGPDGLPGNGQSFTANNLWPPDAGGVLGTGDDIMRKVE